MTSRCVIAIFAAAACGFTVQSTAASDAFVADDAWMTACLEPPDLAWWPLASLPVEPDRVSSIAATASAGVRVIADGPCGAAVTFDAMSPVPAIRIDDLDSWDSLARIELWVRTTPARKPCT